MAKEPPDAHRAGGDPPGGLRTPRSEFRARYSDECNDVIRSLDPDTKAMINSDLVEFTKRWKKSSGDDELRKSRFTYKPLQGKECRNAKLHEIYVGEKRYRVTVTVLVHEEELWFVYCFKKGKADQKQGIARSVRVSQSIRRERK
jgi:hypothetical protein